MTSELLKRLRPELAAMHAYRVPRIPGIEVKLDANESPFQLSSEMREALAQHLAAVPLNRYPDPTSAGLRALIAQEYGVAPESLLFGNGSDEIIQILITCFAEPRAGQERARIFYPSPSFSVFQLFAETHGLEACSAPLNELFELDLAATRDVLARQRPNIAFFARPNNPTGTLWPGEVLLQLATEFRDTLIVSDEAYGEYASGSLVDKLAAHPNLMVMKTLSKVGLAAVRVGFAIARPEVIAELDKARAPYNISSLNQAAAQWALRHCRQALRDHCAEVVRERERVARELVKHLDLQVFASEANLLLFRVGSKGAGEGPRLWQALCDKGVLIRCFGTTGALADCLRVTIGSAEENTRFLAAVRDYRVQ